MWHMNMLKLWGGTCASKNKTTYFLMEHINRPKFRGASKNETTHMLMGHTNRPKLWAGTCPSMKETTYNLMGHMNKPNWRQHLCFKELDHIHIHPDGSYKQAKTMSWHLCFKEWDHIPIFPHKTWGTRGQNGKPGLGTNKWLFKHTRWLSTLNWWLMKCASRSDHIIWRRCDDAYMLKIPSVNSYI